MGKKVVANIRRNVLPYFLDQVALEPIQYQPNRHSYHEHDDQEVEPGLQGQPLQKEVHRLLANQGNRLPNQHRLQGIGQGQRHQQN